MGRLSGRVLWMVEAFGAAIALFVVGVLIYYSFGHFLRAYTLGDTTIDAEYQTQPSKLLVPIAFAIWWLRLALQFTDALRLVLNPHAKPVVVMKDVAEQPQDEIHEVMGDDLDAPEDKP